MNWVRAITRKYRLRKNLNCWKRTWVGVKYKLHPRAKLYVWVWGFLTNGRNVTTLNFWLQILLEGNCCRISCNSTRITLQCGLGELTGWPRETDLLFNALLQEHAFITVVKKLLKKRGEREKHIDRE